MAVQRLDKVIASTGRWSRREVKLLIKEGRVLVDGYPAASAEDKVDPAVNTVEVDGMDIGYRIFYPRNCGNCALLPWGDWIRIQRDCFS